MQFMSKPKNINLLGEGNKGYRFDNAYGAHLDPPDTVHTSSRRISVLNGNGNFFTLHFRTEVIALGKS